MATFSGVFSLLGNLLGAAIGPLQYAYSEEVVFFGVEFDSGLQLMALLAAVLHVCGFWIPLLVLREQHRPAKKRTNLFLEMSITFRNRAFLSLLGVSCLLPMGVVLVVAGLPYLCTLVREREPGQPGLVRECTPISSLDLCVVHLLRNLMFVCHQRQERVWSGWAC